MITSLKRFSRNLIAINTKKQATIEKAYEETFYLLSSKNNADRLNKAIDELRSGGNKEHQLFSLENN